MQTTNGITPHTQQQVEWNDRWQVALDALCARVRQIRTAVGEAWPYHSADGIEWDTTDNGNWCGGHWVECLRIVGELESDQALLKEAVHRADRLQPWLERDDLFRGHRFYYGAARLYAWTHNPKYRTLALAAAYAMRSMAMDVNGVIPVGTQVVVKSGTISGRDKACVDNVHPGIMLDWWAFKATGDRIFIDGARKHLDASVDLFIREDGSTIEFLEFDIESGKVLRHFAPLGANADSCWSRGQAWAIAGYLRAYEELDDPRYLSVARKLLRYWVDNSDETLVPPWDFKDPALENGREKVLKDTSAATVVVEQLARLAVKPNLNHVAQDVVGYLPLMIDGLLKYMVLPGDKQGRPVGMLREGCMNNVRSFATNSELIWGTAYLLFALYYLKTGRVVD